MQNILREQPVSIAERIVSLDVLRGFAMVGVLVAYCLWSLGTAPEPTWSPLDRNVDEVATFLVDGKFYTILAFLFGFGFSIQLSRASGERAAVETYCRRLAVLAAIGLIHALLLRNGDILLPYALTGFLLVPFHRARDRTLLVSAIAILLFNVTLRALWSDLGLPSLERPHLEGAPYLIENAAWVQYWYRTALFTWPLNLTMFLLGLYAGRRAILMKLADRPRALRAIVAVGLIVGAAMHLARMSLVNSMPSSSIAGALASLLFTIHCWGMSSAYAALLLLALRTERGRAALSPLAAIGRLALTNYLLQAAIIVPICLAFGLFNQFTPISALVLAVGVFAIVQVPFSLFWAERFQFGPAEWVWRLLTYQRLPSLRLTRAEAGGI